MTVVYSIILLLVAMQVGGFYFATLSAAVNILDYIAGAFHFRKMDPPESDSLF